MNWRRSIVAAALCAAWSPGLAGAQASPPAAPVNLDRRVFIDVNDAAANTVLAQLADSLECRLEVDRKLPDQGIVLNLSNVRARTALDALCDMVGCRWTLNGRTLRVDATAPPPPAPAGRLSLERMKTPLAGAEWKLDRVALGAVLYRMTQETGVRFILEGVDLSAPVTADVSGMPAVEALARIGETLGLSLASREWTADKNAVVCRLRFRPGMPAKTAAPSPAAHEMGEPGLTMPTVITQVRPRYTREAMQAKVQGVVVVECLVEPDGTVGEVTVVKPLHPLLDPEAVAAAKQWRFSPGTKDGKPVPVRVSLELTFTLK